MLCIYLSTSTHILADRLKDDSSRPLLEEKNKYQMLEKIFNQRKELYLSLSRHQIITDNNTIDDNCNKIIGLIND